LIINGKKCIFVDYQNDTTYMTTEVKEYILSNYKQASSVSELSRNIIDKFKITFKREDSVRRWVSSFLARELHNNVTPTTDKTTDIKPLQLNESKYYILTWEQNNSKLHKQLWENILAYKEFLNAELAVILGVYHKPDPRNGSVYYNKETNPYWDFTRHDIHKYVNILSDVNVSPTAEYPLRGLEGISRDKTSIIGHPKRHFQCLPTLEGTPHKALFTTMSITLPNYIHSKLGKKAEFVHKNGFVIVEIRNEDVFHIRQVEAEINGSFIDLIHEVSNGEVKINDYAAAIVWGDIHVGSTDTHVKMETDRLVNRLNIPISIFHDLADGESVNNHIVNDPIQQIKRLDKFQDDVFEEINQITKFIKEVPTSQNIIVNSNHDNRFDRWIKDIDWKKDIKNARAYLWLADIALNAQNDKGILANILDNNPDINTKVTTLGLNDSYRIGGFELGMHGHIGQGGTRGSLTQFAKLNTPTITGHSHSPGVINDSYSVGTSTYLRLGYNVGASNWAQAHCLLHKNNTVQHIMFTRGHYTTFDI